jgi:hypothetical protein
MILYEHAKVNCAEWIRARDNQRTRLVLTSEFERTADCYSVYFRASAGHKSFIMSHFIVEAYLHINSICNSLSIRQIARSSSIIFDPLKKPYRSRFVTAVLPCELGHLIFISYNLLYYDALSLCVLIERELMRQNVFCGKSSSNFLI